MIVVEPVEGGIRLELDRRVVDFLRGLPELLEEAGADPDDPAAGRLRPAVYPDDAEANEEWWGYMSEELDRSRDADRSTFRAVLEESVGGAMVDSQRAHAVVRVLVEARLVLAARMGIEDEGDYQRLDPDEAAVLDSLGRLQVALLAALPA